MAITIDRLRKGTRVHFMVNSLLNQGNTVYRIVRSAAATKSGAIFVRNLRNGRIVSVPRYARVNRVYAS